MTREDTVKLIRVIMSTYPNWKPENISDTIDAWTWALEDYPFEAIQMAYKVYIRTDKSGFAPSVNQLITNLQKPAETNMLSEAEAWVLVRKAIKNGIYGYNEEFEKFPDIVKKTVVDAKQLHEWAKMPSSDIDTVVSSNFKRDFRTIVKRETEKPFVMPIMNQLESMTQMQIEDKEN